MAEWTLYEGDCLEVMRQLPDNSVDAVVTSCAALGEVKFIGHGAHDTGPRPRRDDTSVGARHAPEVAR